MNIHKKSYTPPLKAERPPIKRREVLLGVSGAALAGLMASPALAAHHEHKHSDAPKHRALRPGGPSLRGDWSDVSEALSESVCDR